MMRPNISNKLREIAAAIDRRGSANLTRLMVLKKWFEVSSHLSSFAIFIADQASRRMTKATEEAAELFREARTLLADVDVFAPKIPRAAATNCMHVFGHSKTSIGTHSGDRCASFMITICSWSNVGFIYIWGMEIRRPRGTVSPRTTANTTIHAMETASMVLAAEGSER